MAPSSDSDKFIPEYTHTELGKFKVMEPKFAKKDQENLSRVEFYLRNNMLYFSKKCIVPKFPTYSIHSVSIKMVLYALFDLHDKYPRMPRGFYTGTIRKQILKNKAQYVKYCYLKSLAIAEYATKKSQFKDSYQGDGKKFMYDTRIKRDHAYVRLKYHGLINLPRVYHHGTLDRSLSALIPFFVYCVHSLQDTKEKDRKVMRHYKLNEHGMELKKKFQKENYLL